MAARPRGPRANSASRQGRALGKLPIAEADWRSVFIIYCIISSLSPGFYLKLLVELTTVFNNCGARPPYSKDIRGQGGAISGPGDGGHRARSAEVRQGGELVAVVDGEDP